MMALSVSKDKALELVGKEVGLSDWLAAGYALEGDAAG